jgi:hypothetical protein
MIDTSGEWWKGQDFDALAEYLRVLTQDEYSVDRVLEPKCSCGGATFRLVCDQDEGVARRACVRCGTEAFIADSEDYAADADLQPVSCVCGGAEFQLAVGFAFREGGDVRWITLGLRCVQCGVLGSPADWKIDYSPTDHLLAQI